MKIVVVGGTGMVGRQLVPLLVAGGHEVIAASPSRGINALTGEGLEAALAQAEVVVDVSNSPSYESQAVMDFFTQSTRHLLAAETAAGVRHHLVLSIVGADTIPDSGYMRAKVAQEKLITESPVPYTIVRATQFFEFLEGIAESCMQDNGPCLPAANMQPIASVEVARLMADLAIREPLQSLIDIAGPEEAPIEQFVHMAYAAKNDPRPVTSSSDARYFGALLSERSLVPQGDATVSPLSLEAWLAAVTC